MANSHAQLGGPVLWVLRDVTLVFREPGEGHANFTAAQ